MELDLIRHLEVVNPAHMPDLVFSFVGAGATSSVMVQLIAKLGFKHINVYDPDVVSKENIPNQLPYGIPHIGMLKVEALQQVIQEQTGTVIKTHPIAVGAETALEGVVFMLTDTMSSRDEIWQGGIKYNPAVRLMIETRMGTRDGRIYTVNPLAPDQVSGWESRWYSDDETEKVTACGGSISVGPTAGFLGSLAVWQFIRWFNAQVVLNKGEEPSDIPEHELLFSLQPPMFYTQNF